LRLWGVGDVTVGNFPHTYNALRRGLAHHDKTGENTFSMVGDLMKFEILFTHGGLYLDTNVELLKVSISQLQIQVTVCLHKTDTFPFTIRTRRRFSGIRSNRKNKPSSFRTRGITGSCPRG